MITHHPLDSSGIGASDKPAPTVVDQAIHSMEAIICDLPGEKVSLEPINHFVPGLYVRELRMPAGTILTGKYHRQKDILILAQGQATFLTKDGQRTLSAPCVTTVEADTKPIINCITDVVFVSAHANPDDTQDMEVIEKRVVITPEELRTKTMGVL